MNIYLFPLFLLGGRLNIEFNMMAICSSRENDRYIAQYKLPKQRISSQSGLIQLNNH